VSRPAALAFIFVTVLLDMLALGLIAPVLAPLVVSFLGGDTARAAEIYGLAFTLFAAMQFVASPVLGALSDRFGRRPVVLLSNLGLGLDYVLMALAPDVAWLLVGRVLSGLTAASITAPAPTSRTSRRRRSARPASRCSAPLSAWASCWAPRSAGCSARSGRACPSGWPPPEPAERGLRTRRPAGIVAARAARGLRVASRQSRRRARHSARAPGAPAAWPR
jgi:MFS family permease